LAAKAAAFGPPPMTATFCCATNACFLEKLINVAACDSIQKVKPQVCVITSKL
jgi:hypothetical protein